ncbi:MAG TPA: hypothetical protein VIM53_02400 [Candidatus Saccharimonadales bacterium]
MKRFWLEGCALVLALAFVPATFWWQKQSAKHFVQTHATVTTKPLDIFEWRGVGALNVKNYNQTLTTLANENYRTVFVSFDTHAEAQNPQAYETRVDNFGAVLAAHHMQVGLVAGDPSWTGKAQQPAIANVLTFVQTYNKQSGHRIASVEFDIEPYTAGTPAKQTAEGLADAAKYVSAAEHLGANVKIGFTAPFWLTQNTGGAKDFAQAVSALPGGFVTLMDYRLQTSGANGSVALAQPFFTLANAAHVELLVGLDTTKAAAGTTFFGTNNFTLRLAQYTIDQAEKGQASYAGQSVNDVQNFTRLH